MQRSYAVTWQENGDAPRSGKLELGSSSLRLEGGHNGSGPVVVPYSDLLGMGVARTSERITGRPTLLLYRRGREPLRIASVVASSIISEVAEQLAARKMGLGPAESRLMVVVPLRKGVREQVAELIDKGPPFDPEETGLERHLAFVTEREAVFLFESKAMLSLERLMAETNVWASAAAWRPFVAGAPRIAEPAFSWTRKPETLEAEGLSFDAEPGPGDSEGGDVYAP